MEWPNQKNNGNEVAQFMPCTSKHACMIEDVHFITWLYTSACVLSVVHMNTGKVKIWDISASLL